MEQELAKRETVHMERCIEITSQCADNGRELLAAHLEKYGTVRPEEFVPEVLIPTIIKTGRTENALLINTLCTRVDYMWAKGDAEVRELLTRTVFAPLLNKPTALHRFFRCMSPAFKKWFRSTFNYVR